MEILAASAAAYALDVIFGDPAGIPHIIIGLGKLIAALEKLLRAVFPKTKGGELCAGVLLAALTPAVAFGAGWGVLYLCGLVGPWLRFAAEVFLGWQCLAQKSLADSCRLVYDALESGDIVRSREMVGRVVGRDTAELDAGGDTRAAVETVAENASDGEIAPMIYLAVGGAPLAMLYKAINTMDSMVGYKNDRYIYFGRAAAKLDDLANLIPARVSGLLFVVSASICGFDGKNAWRIFKRDRYNHLSPNSAQTESPVAGALHIQLGGSHNYFGKLVIKPTQGDDDRPVEPQDIIRTIRMMNCASVLALILCLAVRAAALIF